VATIFSTTLLIFILSNALSDGAKFSSGLHFLKLNNKSLKAAIFLKVNKQNLQ